MFKRFGLVVSVLLTALLIYSCSDSGSKSDVQAVYANAAAFEGYVDKYADLLAAYNANSAGKTKSAWGEWHYCNYGRGEGRTYSGLSAASCGGSDDGGGSGGDAFEGYVNKYADLLAAYNANSGGKTKSAWGEWHYCNHGRNEGRTYSGLSDSSCSSSGDAFETYVNKYADLLAAYNASGGGQTKSAWGEWHYCNHGRGEGRTYSGLSAASCGSNDGGGNDGGGNVSVPNGTPYVTYTADIKDGGSGTGHSAYIVVHDAYNNALGFGIQSDTAAPETHGAPWYIWQRVQNGVFTFKYIKSATTGTAKVTIKWWKDEQVAVVYENGTAIANISVKLVPRLFFNAEGNARLNGDSVNSTVKNVDITVGTDCPTYCGLNGSWNTTSYNFYGLTATNTNGRPQNGANFSITGTATGIPPGLDWDTTPNPVGGIGKIAQYWNGQ